MAVIERKLPWTFRVGQYNGDLRYEKHFSFAANCSATVKNSIVKLQFKSFDVRQKVAWWFFVIFHVTGTVSKKGSLFLKQTLPTEHRYYKTCLVPI